jgi:predicted RNA-binding Zn ribbon-like protein
MRAPSVHWSDFRFNAGRLALDLPATVRRRASAPHDVLAASGEAARLLKEAGLVGRQLRLRAAQVQQLLQLREAIWAAADARAHRRVPPASVVQVINSAAGHPLPVPRLDLATFERVRVASDAFQSAPSVIARDAIELLAGSEARRVRRAALHTSNRPG